MTHKYTFVTVSHAVDYGQLKLQAQSMALYCPASLVHEILVVENFDPGAELNWRPTLLTAYGPLAGLVRFIPGEELADMPDKAAGWWRQQCHKLLVAKRIHTHRYVVLDAKNHLVRPLSPAFLEASDGRPRLNGYGFETHPLKDALIRTLGYLGVDATRHIPHFTRTSTPYVMITRESLAVISYVAKREHKPFSQAFLDLRLTEFFLYAGFLTKGGVLELLYDMTQPHCAQIWGHSATEAGCKDAVERASKLDGCPFLAVHRVALAQMDVVPRVIVAELWADCGLFRSVTDAVKFSLNPNA